MACLIHGGAKFRVHFPIRMNLAYALHLDHKSEYGMISMLFRPDQFPDMLYAPLCWCVREEAHTVDLQCTSLHFHEIPPWIKACLFLLHVEIDPGISKGVFRSDQTVSLCFKPFPHHLVGSLAVDIEQNPGVLSYRYQVIPGLSVRCPRLGQPHLAAGDQKLPATTGILYMNDLFPSVDFHMRDKSIWS